MKLASVRIQNFRCFGSSAATIDLSGDITALVGANGSGKTALLMALSRMFGVTQRQRTIVRSDFHVPADMSPEDRTDCHLVIDARIAFPELAEAEGPVDGIPPTFNQMIVAAPGAAPVCRIRLEAAWTDDGTAEGTVEQRQYWVLTDDLEPAEESKQRLLPFDRALIQVLYVPADRDPAQEIRYAAQTGLGRIMRAISWNDETRQAVGSASRSIGDALTAEKGIGTVNGRLQQRWTDLIDEYAASHVSLRFAQANLEQLVRDFGVSFVPGDDGRESDLTGLSDGQQSLFYLALVGAISDIEAMLVAAQQRKFADVHDQGDGGAGQLNDNALEVLGFQVERLRVPSLTILALEEPENHLAPHYLARIVHLLRGLANSGRTQAVFSSHSPAILRRVEPHEVRHFRIDVKSHTSTLSAITLPDSAEEASKYVREAIMAYPELYFAKFVILAEGPSEEIVLPQIAAARQFHVDQSFVSLVPLGGRHVNHFWRLLNGLSIPHATLLDLDAGRETGGWARIKYVCQQLLQNGRDSSTLLKFEHEGVSHELSGADLQTLHEHSLNSIDELVPWCRHLEQFGVYFSAPLDFDFAMLDKFRDAYQGVNDGSGPRIPEADSEKRDLYIQSALLSVLGNDACTDLYAGARWEDLFPWYRYLFSRSKPATHLQALSALDGRLLSERAPAAIIRLLENCEKAIQPRLGAS